MPFFWRLVGKNQGLSLRLKLLLKVSYMRAFSSGRRCRACEADEVSLCFSQLLIHRKRSPFSRKRRLIYAALLAVDW